MRDEGSFPMSTVQVQLNFEQLLAAIHQLSPAQQLKIRQSLDSQQRHNGAQARTNGKGATTESELIAQTQATLPPKEARRLKSLIRKSERATLTAAESEEYRQLAKQSQALDVKRIAALTRLAQLRGQSVDAVKRQIHWRAGSDET
jgi:hypothetical protein